MGYYLCTVKKADQPYYLENLGIMIYSIEELCYYLYDNIYLFDEKVLQMQLCDWIREELGLAKLAKQLQEALEKRDKRAFLYSIFREAGYLDAEEFRKYQEKLNKMELLSPDLQKKLRGDAFLKRKLYSRAISEYQAILSQGTSRRSGMPFFSSVWSNLGCAYAGLFEYEQAAECFLTAWRGTKSRDAFRKYISVQALLLSPEEYRRILTEENADEITVSRIRKYNADIYRECQEEEEALESSDFSQWRSQEIENYIRGVML